MIFGKSLTLGLGKTVSGKLIGTFSGLLQPLALGPQPWQGLLVGRFPVSHAKVRKAVTNLLFT